MMTMNTPPEYGLSTGLHSKEHYNLRRAHGQPNSVMNTFENSHTRIKYVRETSSDENH